MSIENNKHLFLICVGLAASGSDGYDHSDAEVSNLVGMIQAAGFSDVIKAWFARARTGQVAVNPYWPRGSQLASACFFVDCVDCQFHFDSASFFTFLESAGDVADPISPNDFKEWILRMPTFLRLLDEHPATPGLWHEYCRIVDNRSPQWRTMVEQAVHAAERFFGDEAPEMVFSPNLFTPYNADFVRIGNRIITISSVPYAETMLHETLHTAVAKHREEITKFAEEYGLASFADKARMMELGYMEDETAASAAHVIEECFVRALSVVLAGGGEERLRFHGRYGFDSTLRIVSHIRRRHPDYQSLGTFIKEVLSEMERGVLPG